VRLRLTPRAVEDLSEIADYVRQRNPAAALRVRAAILESLQNILLFPQVGRPQKLDGVRKLVTRRYPYLVYYTIDEGVQEVMCFRFSIRRVNASMRMREQRDSADGSPVTEGVSSDHR
jgi:toxin ParE1/3/4